MELEKSLTAKDFSLWNLTAPENIFGNQEKISHWFM